MKTKYWIVLLSAILILCAGLSIPLLSPGEDALFAQIISDGKPVTTVDLRLDQSFTVTSSYGANTVTVKDGTIGVTEASCPDHYCMERGMCSSGVQIVCLPNKLIIRFQGQQAVDSVVG